MTRDVVINFVSQIADDVTYISNDISHGEFESNGYCTPTLYGTSNPSFKSGGQQVASLHKTTGSTYGVTGNLTYQLPNSQGNLVFMFNNPYTQSGSGFNGNCWVYAAITGIPATSTTTYFVEVTGTNMALDPPVAEDTITATVTLMENPSDVS